MRFFQNFFSPSFSYFNFFSMISAQRPEDPGAARDVESGAGTPVGNRFCRGRNRRPGPRRDGCRRGGPGALTPTPATSRPMPHLPTRGDGTLRGSVSGKDGGGLEWQGGQPEGSRGELRGGLATSRRQSRDPGSRPGSRQGPRSRPGRSHHSSFSRAHIFC